MTRGKCVIAPGNHTEHPEQEIWYPAVANALQNATKDGELVFSQVVLRQFPDWYIGRESVWIPFLESELLVGVNDVIIGHSTGAIAALRYAETHKVKGIVLVGAYHTDLGDPDEVEAEYFSHPFDYAAIRRNCTFIIQYASPNDEFVPITEQRFVAGQLKPEYYEITTRGHCIDDHRFDELVKALLIKF
ncbi:putative hydrolase RBBP9-like protein [Umbelopsis sp. PMI_123]|nr:putative hydrolase RBBP9-like protein [Umbelopsis sp. PMI_123]